jgi:TolB-like protein
MSPQHDQDYFCEGMAEELINALTKVKGLSVASRTSSFQSKEKTKISAALAKNSARSAFWRAASGRRETSCASRLS